IKLNDALENISSLEYERNQLIKNTRTLSKELDSSEDNRNRCQSDLDKALFELAKFEERSMVLTSQKKELELFSAMSAPYCVLQIWLIQTTLYQDPTGNDFGCLHYYPTLLIRCVYF